MSGFVFLVQSISKNNKLKRADEEVSTAALRNVVKPWKGVVITFTGVDRKVCSRLSCSWCKDQTDDLQTQFAALAIELGARIENALTVHVTHVVAVSCGSDKYKVGPPG